MRQDARQRRAAKRNERNPTGKLRLAEAANFKADWALERRDEGGMADDDDDSFSSSLLKSKRSKFTKMVRDEINTSVNSRNNLVFEGAFLLLIDSCRCLCVGQRDVYVLEWYPRPKHDPLFISALMMAVETVLHRFMDIKITAGLLPDIGFIMPGIVGTDSYSKFPKKNCHCRPAHGIEYQRTSAWVLSRHGEHQGRLGTGGNASERR